MIALAGMSLGINSYLVKEKVGDINDNLKNMSLAVRTLEVNGAVFSQQINATNNRLDTVLSPRIERHHERISALESSVAKIAGRLQIDINQKP